MNRFTQSAKIPGLLSLVLVVGCSDPGGPRGTRGLIPLNVGATWGYEISDSVEYGQPPVTDGRPPSTFRMRVIADTVIARERWAVVDGAELLLTGQNDQRFYLSNREGGMYVTTSGTYEGPFPLPSGPGPAVLFFRYPARVGDRGPAWDVWVVTATDTLIAVPAGSFRTIRYDMGEHETYFVAPGVGVVKKVGSSVTAWSSSGQMLWRTRPVHELTDFAGLRRE